MGAMLEAIPKKKKTKQGSGAGTLYSLPPGIDKKTSHDAQQLSQNENVIAEAGFATERHRA